MLGMYGSKLSILLLYLRVFSVQRNTRRATWVAIGYTIGLTLLVLITDAINRTPPPGKPWIQENLKRNNTIQPTVNIVIGYLRLALDIVIFIIPLHASWKLQMGVMWKLKIMLVFGTGLL